MSLLEDLADKFSLVKILSALKTVQAGQQNIQIENLTVTINISPEEVKRLIQKPITEELDNKIKQENMKRLSNVQRSLSFMTNEASAQLVAASTLASALDIIEEEKK